jgi:uncharacterized protein YeaO (DUF488 family)
MFEIKRIYEDYAKTDGYRVLVDRLWPRGVSREKAHLDIWLKEIAPSTELRNWFHHDPQKWEEFIKRYKHELIEKKDLLKQLKAEEQKHKKVTLLFGAKDTIHNEAVVLLDVLT